MDKQIVVCVRDEYSIIGIFEDSRLTDLFVERKAERNLVGNIYQARVNKVLPAIQAAFLDYGYGKDGFLGVMDAQYGVKGRNRRLANISDLLKMGKLITIQIEKEAIAEKGCKLTTDLSLPGRYVVLMPHSDKISVSRKITNEQVRRRLQDTLKSMVSEEAGWIIRTVAQEAQEDDLKDDIIKLWKTWEKIRRDAERAKRPQLLHSELKLVEQVLRDHFSHDIRDILVDDQEERRRVDRYLKAIAPHNKTMRAKTQYISPERLVREYSLQREIERAINRKVWLKCGGYLIIEEMETLSAIDVNTGRNTRGTDQDQTILETNLEAAEEVARQLRLRNIGGIIIVDFIDMRLRKDRTKVLGALKKHLEADKAANDVLEFTEIGLAQITRQRSEESLLSSLTQECPTCRGNGRLLHLA